MRLVETSATSIKHLKEREFTPKQNSSWYIPVILISVSWKNTARRLEILVSSVDLSWYSDAEPVADSVNFEMLRISLFEGLYPSEI